MNTGEEYHGQEKLTVANGEKLAITHVGKGSIPTLIPYKSLYLDNVLAAPLITKNLLSISSLLANNEVTIEFDDNLCYVKDKKLGKILLK